MCCVHMCARVKDTEMERKGLVESEEKNETFSEFLFKGHLLKIKRKICLKIQPS